jgi:glucose-1-phosphate cytidylyltransferase
MESAVQKQKDVPVVILCGGMGTRLTEHTTLIPKPLVEIGHKPILWHIMKHYSRYGFHKFFLALGYKGDHIKRYFLEFYSLGQDFTVSLKNGEVSVLNQKLVEPWEVHLVDTGQTTLTGGRLKLLEPLLRGGTFMMTYGDGVGDVNLDKLLAFHYEMGGLVTLTAVRPPARFGAMEFDGNRVCRFKEKTKLSEGWINGGFFVMEPQALDYIEDDVLWEHAPLERLAADGKLFAYRHEDFWQCMDTVRDLKYLESLWESGNPPWKTW